ncbi:hypothetical protein [uncultured Prevotella sp.]|jgi:hypothetical protein|uniref:hypothetical protein n=1 Tax=uncultured Prevotella sp. TaxID=159272 RepID=UPI0027E3AB16|nr:hypothetical protein [uncultured Prevotella sp.]
MENKLNIAEILKDCPKGTKLYSPLFGEVTLEEVDTECTALITIKYNANICSKFFKTGLYYNYEGAECLLFPSSEMRDWSKFFKRGDVAIHSFNGCGVLVEEWTDDSYTSFKASVFQLKKGGFAKRDKRVLSIDDFVKASDEQRDKFISDMEKFFGGKYNPDTMQVEPMKPECQFKPFDKVLVRNYKDAKWNVNFFSYYEDGAEYKYHCLISSYRYCIHYEGNEHFLNTTKPYTEGGSE